MKVPDVTRDGARSPKNVKDDSTEPPYIVDPGFSLSYERWQQARLTGFGTFILPCLAPVNPSPTGWGIPKFGEKLLHFCPRSDSSRGKSTCVFGSHSGFA
jgi:hypothetical protein